MFFDVKNFPGVGSSGNRYMNSLIPNTGRDNIDVISLYPGMGLTLTVDYNDVKGYLHSAFFSIGCKTPEDARKLAEQMHLYSTYDKDIHPEYFV